jgi:hypothetical protein
MTENQEIGSAPDGKQGAEQGKELQGWIDNVIIPILVQKILEERRQSVSHEMSESKLG